MSSANTFGTHFRITSFGESHGAALGAVIEGCPAGVKWNDELLRAELGRRRPGQVQAGRVRVVTDRDEADQPEILSGVFEGITLGTPIAVIVRNTDTRSQDYAGLAARAGHADDVWKQKFAHSDPRGGGRSSGRETLTRVIGGAVAQMLLDSTTPGLRVCAFASAIGPFKLSDSERTEFLAGVQSAAAYAQSVDAYVARFPSASRQDAVEKLLLEAKQEGKSYGGIVEIRIDGVPAGLGQPVAHKLKADFAAAMMSVGATSSFEVGAGFLASDAEGSEFHSSETSKQEKYGGIRGGISTGESIILRIGFKPTSSVLDVAKRGRHDPCIVPRAVPVLEAMAYLVLADHVQWARHDRI